jgi:hypothetical protein
MVLVRCVAGAIGHRQDDPCANRPRQLDGLFDLLVGGSELLRTCEVGYRSRFAMEGENKGKVHQLLGLGVQGAGVMNLLEVVRVALAGVKVTAPEFRHFSPHQSGAGNELEGEPSPRHGHQSMVAAGTGKRRG